MVDMRRAAWRRSRRAPIFLNNATRRRQDERLCSPGLEAF
jgi:hypothetical protein